MTLVIVYWLVLFIYSIIMWKRQRTEASFLVYERKSGSFIVAMSLTSLVFGASSVFGLAGYAYTYNLNAIWWTLSGIIFLIILRMVFLSRLVDLKAYTISDTVSSVFGPKYKIITSALILISWIMILAVQIIAGGNILSMITGNRELSYILFCMIFFSYTFVTGQSGAIRTSWLQTFLMIIGIALLLWYVVSIYGTLPDKKVQLSFGFNNTFTPGFFLNIFIPVGLSYLFGPDIYSRIFTARNVKSAGRGIIAACVLITVISIMIVLIGVYSAPILGKVSVPDQIIPTLASMQFSGVLKSLILVLLISIPLSGADAMLANMATYLGKDIAGGIYTATTGRSSEKMSVILIRLSMIIISAAAVITALNSKSIIPTLLIAYKIFSVVVVPFIMVSMLSLKYNVKWENRALKIVLAVYTILSAGVVIAFEMKLISSSIQYLPLYLTGINISMFLALFLGMKLLHRK